MPETKGEYIVEVQDGLKINYVLLSWAIAKFLENNWKQHNAGVITKSFFQYGFRDPIAYDSTLNNGNGGIVEGNGRLEMLARCFNNDPTNIPRNIYPVTGINGDDWAIPIVFGGDAATENEARQYAINHNVSTMMGGSFTMYDILERGGFDHGIYDELRESMDNQEPLAAIELDDWDAVELAIAQQETGLLEDGLEEEFEEPQYQPPSKDKYVIAIACDKETYEDWLSVKENIKIRDDLRALRAVMARLQG